MKVQTWRGKGSALVRLMPKPHAHTFEPEKRGRGTMEPLKTHGAASPQQGLTQPAGGRPSGPRPEDLVPGGHEGANPHVGTRVANAVQPTAGTSQTPEVTANMLGGCTRFHIFESFYTESKKYKKNGSPDDLTRSDLMTVLYREMGQELKNLSPSEEDRLIHKIVNPFLTKAMSFYKKCNRNKKRFRAKHTVFLNKLFIDDIPDEFKRVAADVETFKVCSTVLHSDDTQSAATLLDSTATSSLSGSSKLTNDPSSKDLKIKKRIEETLLGQPVAKVIKCFASTITSENGSKLTPEASKDLEELIKVCLTSPDKPSAVLKKNSTVREPCTPEEALSFIIQTKMSVKSYEVIIDDLNYRGFHIYPPYHEVLNARKACYPEEEIGGSETEASVSLHGLLTHTLQRIVQSCDDIFVDYCDRTSKKEVSCVFEGSWGFDTCPGITLCDELLSVSDEGIPKNENTIFGSTFLPLRIVMDKHIAWLNPLPQSYRFCRPLHIHYRKETTEYILKEKTLIEEQIKRLTPITIQTSKGHNITFVCDLTLSVIDGKVLNAITGTPSQLRCPFCKLTASQFNDLTPYTKPAIKENIQHAINPLHAWIRIFEFLLHLGYKNDPLVRKWRINKGSKESEIVEERKKRIQAEIEDRFELYVDLVKGNLGPSNDDYGARKALSNKYRAIFAEILGLDAWLVDGLHVILVTLSCQHSIDAKKFGIFCRTLAERYVQSFNWHPMSATVHKILVHGEEIIESCCLSVCMLEEQFWRSDGQDDFLERNRRNIMMHTFQRALESSDPFVSMVDYRQSQKACNRNRLPEAVRELLKPIPEENMQVADDDDEDETSSDDDDDDLFKDDDYAVILENENDLYES